MHSAYVKSKIPFLLAVEASFRVVSVLPLHSEEVEGTEGVEPVEGAKGEETEVGGPKGLFLVLGSQVKCHLPLYVHILLSYRLFASLKHKTY